ncbi:MAG: DUF1700 domain-containing protein [Eubacteriaceae bacterium]|nr:DUF1700 domain-containing protein [Eubacteriaceae bacterium]
MNRQEFIDELKARLRKLPYDETREAVEYYEQYFDDAGAENEQAVIQELGPPAAVARQIIAGYAVKGSTAKVPLRESWHSAWLVILALMASPIAVPLALAAGAVALALAISLSAVVFSLFAAGAGAFIAGIACAVGCIVIAAKSFPTAVMLLGAALMLLGIGAAIILWASALSKLGFSWLSKMVGNYILRRKHA